jgi:hypothetical protein
MVGKRQLGIGQKKGGRGAVVLGCGLVKMYLLAVGLCVYCFEPLKREREGESACECKRSGFAGDGRQDSEQQAIRGSGDASSGVGAERVGGCPGPDVERGTKTRGR